MTIDRRTTERATRVSHRITICALVLTFTVVIGTSGCGSRSEPTKLPGADRGDTKLGATTRGENQRETDDAGTGSLAKVDFREVDSPTIASFIYRHGGEAGLATLLEIVGGGVTCCDYDLDGQTDLAFAGGGKIDPDSKEIRGAKPLFCRGRGGFRFDDVTAASGLATKGLYSHGFAAADWNDDGFVDLALYGYGGVLFYQNQGDGTFIDVTSRSSLPPLPWVTAAAFGELNGDGVIDLYLGSYATWDLAIHRTCPGSDGKPDVCSPNAFDAAQGEILIGQGDGTFRSGSGLVAPASEGKSNPLVGKALGALIGRLDGGVWPSLYVTNDMLPNTLLRRGDDGMYRDVAIAAGVAVDDSGNANASMGVTALDFSGVGRFDLLVTNFDHEQIALYRSDGSGTYRHASRAVGLNRIEAAVVGFGVAAADFGGTGWEDILLTSGHVRYYPDRGEIRQQPVLLRNRFGEGVRQETPACGYFKRKTCGRGLAVADFDHDGDQDVVITHLFEPPVLLENLSPPTPWLEVALVGKNGPRDAIGAIARVRVGDRVLTRQRFGGGSFLSQSDSKLFFRWPQSNDGPVELEVDWPSGRQQRLTGVTPGRSLRITEPP